MQDENTQVDSLEDLDQFVARTKPLRQYEQWYLLAKAKGVIQIRMEDSSKKTLWRYKYALAKEKYRDKKGHNTGILSFSYVGNILTVRFRNFDSMPERRPASRRVKS